MEHRTANEFLINLKAFVLGIVIALLTIVLFSFRTGSSYNDLWEQLGIAKERANTNIKDSFLSGYLQHYGARNIKNIAVNDRAAVATDLLAYTKDYVKSPSFKTEYDRTRQATKPIEPAAAKTEIEIRKKFIEDTQKAIDNLENGIKTANAEFKKMFQESLELQKKQLKEYQDPNNELIQMATEGEKIQYNSRMEEFKTKTQEWEVKFPVSQFAFIKLRLTEMLDATKDVDFAAETVTRNNKKYFVNPAYERKSNNWKFAFRAGKETTVKVRAFAQEWIKELN